MSARLFHPKIDWEVQGVFTEGSEAFPKRLASRVRSAYGGAISDFEGHATSMWGGIDGVIRHVTLMSPCPLVTMPWLAFSPLRARQWCSGAWTRPYHRILRRISREPPRADSADL